MSIQSPVWYKSSPKNSSLIVTQGSRLLQDCHYTTTKVAAAKIERRDGLGACNPNQLGGRDQEDRSLKSALANSLRDPISKKTNTKNG
jgi:hypothetical protein